jgi:hypothetical protein
MTDDAKQRLLSVAPALSVGLESRWDHALVYKFAVERGSPGITTFSPCLVLRI